MSKLFALLSFLIVASSTINASGFATETPTEEVSTPGGSSEDSDE